MSKKSCVSTSSAPQAIGPYSQAVVANGQIYVSGQIGLSPNTQELVSNDIKEQTEQVLRNVAAVLAAAGSSLADVVLSTVYVTDMQSFPEVNSVYRTHFPSDPPARATVGVASLPKNAQVEISVIALAPSK